MNLEIASSRLSRQIDKQIICTSEIRDMSYPGSNLHKLSGNLKWQYVVNISGNWRIFFKFFDGNFYIVNYYNYHWGDIHERNDKTANTSMRNYKGWLFGVIFHTITKLASTLHVSRKTLSKIINGNGAITPDMALRLSRAFDTSPSFWINLQRNYDLWKAENTSSTWESVKPFPAQLLHAGC